MDAWLFPREATGQKNCQRNECSLQIAIFYFRWIGGAGEGALKMVRTATGPIIVETEFGRISFHECRQRWSSGKFL